MTLILIIVLCVYVIFFIEAYISRENTRWNIITFLPMGIIAIFAIIMDQRNYSLNKMHWYFIFIFLFLSPISQLSSGYYPWNYKYDLNLIGYTNFVIILWEVFYFLSYTNKSHKKIVFRMSQAQNCMAQKNITPKDKTSIQYGLLGQILLLGLSFFAVAIMIYKNGIMNLFIRNASGFGTGTFGILLEYLFRSIPVHNSAIMILQRKKHQNIPIIYIGLHLICVFILNYPPALWRFWIGTVYLGLLICIVPSTWFADRRFDFAILVALVVVFPLFRIFKKNTLQMMFEMKINMDFISVYNDVDFDAYSMLLRIIDYTMQEGFCYGTQLRSVLLFFIPRSLWNIKGIPTGEMVAAFQNNYFTNVSAPIMAEGYVDFGIVGVIAYAWISGYILKAIDKRYWQDQLENELHYRELILPFLMGFIIFIMRGALQPTFLRLMGFFLYIIMLSIVRKMFPIIKIRYGRRTK